MNTHGPNRSNDAEARIADLTTQARDRSGIATIKVEIGDGESRYDPRNETISIARQTFERPRGADDVRWIVDHLAKDAAARAVPAETRHTHRARALEIAGERGFIPVDHPNEVQIVSDFLGLHRTGWELVGLKKDPEHPKQTLLLLFRTAMTSEGETYHDVRQCPRHIAEKGTDFRWLRDLLSEIPPGAHRDAAFLKNDFAETLDDRTRREWTEKRRALQAFRGSWEDTSVELLERQSITLMERHVESARMYLALVGPMVSKIENGFSAVHEQFMLVATARDFYRHLAERLGEDPAGPYSKRAAEIHICVEAYERLIRDKS